MIRNSPRGLATRQCRRGPGRPGRSGSRSSIKPARGEKAAHAKLHEIAQLPIEMVGVDMGLGKLAASLKAEHNLPYADCFAGALAQARKAALITSDKDFERVGTTLKTIWV